MNTSSIKTALCRILAVFVLLVLSLPFGVARADDDEIRRNDMIDIAEAYETHSWTAREEHVRRSPIDTPDRAHYTHWPDWKGWDIGLNTGVPYAWGGWSPLPDLGLKLTNGNDGYTFTQQLDLDYAAGDICCHGGGQGGVAGVDCSGLVSHAWRKYAKHNTAGLRNDARPIQFQDLRPGDLLYWEDAASNFAHVMLFKEFVNDDVKDTPGETRIRVIEASSYDWKVSEMEYLLTSLDGDQESWRGTAYQTSWVTLRRDNDDHDFENYQPRTYLNPISLVFVIDRSGSMGSAGKMDEAKESAKMFVDLMRTRDKVGVVAFDSTAEDIYELKEIDADGTVITETKAAIDGITPQGATSIGDGLQKGQVQLPPHGPDDPIRLMFLLSDGLENERPNVDDVLPGIVDDGIVVHTVAFGDDADQELSQRIADQTGGEYRSAAEGALTEIYLAILARVYGDQVVDTRSGAIFPDETIEDTVLVDSTVDRATFLLSWEGSQVDLSLIRPDGTLVDPSAAQTDPDVSFTSGDTYQFYRIAGPQRGEWIVRLFGKSVPAGGEDYIVSVTVADAMISTVTSDKPLYYVDDPITVTASIEDGFLDTLEPQYMLGLVMEATVEDPAQNTHHFQLRDDGLHGDGAADDGIHAGTFTETALPGSYNFRIKVSGHNLRDGQAFTREYGFSALVSDAAPAIQTIRASADPTSMPADGASTSAITAFVEDQYGNPIEDGTVVSFSTDLGTVSPDTDTTVGGVAGSTLTAGETPGPATVLAAADSMTDTVTVSFAEPEPVPVGGMTYPLGLAQPSLLLVPLVVLSALLVAGGTLASRKRKA